MGCGESSRSGSEEAINKETKPADQAMKQGLRLSSGEKGIFFGGRTHYSDLKGKRYGWANIQASSCHRGAISRPRQKALNIIAEMCLV